MSLNASSRTSLGLRRIAAVLLIAVLLTNSSFAAPEAARELVVRTSQISQDLKFEFAAVDLGSFVNGLAYSFFFVRWDKQDDPHVTRIEISPGPKITVRQGQPVNFVAIGYDAKDTPIGGVKFDWTVAYASADGDASEYLLSDGTFSGWTPGNFVITAAADGVRTQVSVTVEEDQGFMTLKKIKDDEANGRTDQIRTLKAQGLYKTNAISSKRVYSKPAKSLDVSSDDVSQSVSRRRVHGPTSDSDVPESETLAEGRTKLVRRPANEDGWNDNNWWMADDPGNQPGNPPGTSPEAAAGNGNFQFSTPVVSLPGRGIDLNLSLIYNARVWSKAGTTMSFDAERGYPAPGWNLGFGKMMYMGSTGGCMLIDADGTNHGYTGTIMTWGGGNDATINFVGHTTDGTFIDYSCWIRILNGVTSMISPISQLPNGTKVSYNVNSSNGKQAFPSSIQDAQGNYINVAYRNNNGPEIQTITDTLGRVITFNYDSSTPARLISVDVPKMANAGTRTAVRLNYNSLTLNTGWAQGITPDTNNATPNVISAIYYPGTSTGYWFKDSDSYSSYGMITKVIEQRAMGWDQGNITIGTMTKQAVYNYPPGPLFTLTDAPTYDTLEESWFGMDTDPVITNYELHMNDDPRTITVSQPHTAAQGTQVKSKQTMYNASGLWYDGLTYKDETLDSSNNQLAKSVVTWEQGSYDSPRPAQTDSTDEKLQISRTSYTYGGSYNQVISQKQYDYDTTTVLRETRNAYENGTPYTNRHIFNLVTSTEVYDGSNNRQSRVDYTYDGAALVYTPGVTMFSAQNDPQTTQVYNTGNCLHWYQPPFGGPQCTQWEILSVYQSATLKRGNVTQITTYTDAAPTVPTGSISQTKQYDLTGNVIAESASCCELKTYTYTSGTKYAYPTTQTRGSSDPNSTLRNTSTAVFDVNTGLVTQTTDPSGRNVWTTYDPDSLRPTFVSAPTTAGATNGAGAQTAYTESSTSISITEEVKDDGGLTASKNVKYLNGLGLVNRVDAYQPNGIIDIVQTKYNELGQVWQQSKPYRTGTAVWTVKYYDLLGRVVKIHEPDGSETTAVYNGTQKPTSAASLVGSTVKVVDAWGRERWGRYDVLGRLAEVVEPNPTGDGSVFSEYNMVTSYSYDTLGRLTQSDQGGQLRKFKYDSLGRLTRQKLAEQTATLDDDGIYRGSADSNAKWSMAVVYDNRSNVTQRTDARGVKTIYSYQIGVNDDPLNRVQSITYDTSGPHYGTIAFAATVTYEYMTSGDQDRLKKVTASGVSSDELTYDGEARVNSQKKTFLTRPDYYLLTNYSYDALDRLKNTLTPNEWGMTGAPQRLVEYSFDESSRLKTLKFNGSQQAGDIQYNASGQTTSINIGTATTNQVNEQYAYDSNTGLLTQQQVWRGGSRLLDLSYDYSRNNSIGSLNGKTGHLTKIVNNLDNNKNREYVFDAVGRLTSAKGGVNGSLWSQTYAYDRYGNRTSVAATGSSADINSTTMPTDGLPTLTYNAANNQITTWNSTGQFEYDPAGNQTRALDQDGVNWLRYEYDAANRLINIWQDNGTTLVQSQKFGVGNERIAVTDEIVHRTTWYGDAIEYTEQGTSGILAWTKTCVYLADSVLSTITPNGANGEYIEFNHPDRLGIRLITNQPGGTSYEQAHLPFGKALDTESSIYTNSKRFTSYERSSRTGLDHAVNRTYDSKQGRFTQVDPLQMGAASLAAPQTLNLYTYCGNDPVNNLDPDGLDFFSWLGHLIMQFFRSETAKRIAIKFIASYIVSGGNLSVAIHSVAPDILSSLGLNPNLLLTPSWNPDLPHPLNSGGVGSLNRYIIFNLIAGAARASTDIIRGVYLSALWRIRTMPGCKEFIQEEFTGQDPETVLKALYDRGQIRIFGPIMTQGAVARSTLGTGSAGDIRLDAGQWRDDPTVGGWRGHLNRFNTQTLVLLHELKHIVGTPHDVVIRDGHHVRRDDAYFYKGIAEKCFGVKTEIDTTIRFGRRPVDLL